MTESEELNALADRCELEGPSRALDADIHEALNTIPGTSWVAGSPSWQPYYTTSLDAAVTLVPEGWDVSLYWGVPYLKPCAQLETEAMRAKHQPPESADASTIALALCAAALRARATAAQLP